MPSAGGAPVPISPFSDWKKTCMPFRDVICDERRDPDAEIDEHARLDFPGDAARDDDLRFHRRAHEFATR